MFQPPRCPNPSCIHHSQPSGHWFRKRGSYQVQCRTLAIPRFHCRACSRSFSLQTFRHDRGDHRPECNAPLFLLLTSGVGMRQAGRLLGLDIRSIQGKLRKFSRTCEHLHRNLTKQLPGQHAFVFDEAETFAEETIQPLTMPVVVERNSWFVVSFGVASIRRLARAGSRRRKRQAEREQLFGRRRDGSRTIVKWVLRQTRKVHARPPIELVSDRKPSYGRIVKEVFGARTRHSRIPGSADRNPRNPLFPINTTLAMARDNNGRLRRRSWLHSKCSRGLVEQMHLFRIYRNCVRRRFNHDDPANAPAVFLDLLPRALTAGEVLGWRQDWDRASPCPTDPDGLTTVAEVMTRSPSAAPIVGTPARGRAPLLEPFHHRPGVACPDPTATDSRESAPATNSQAIADTILACRSERSPWIHVPSCSP